MRKEKNREEMVSQIDEVERVLGEVHGRLGEFTVYRRLGKRVVRRRPSSVRPPTRKQLLQREKFARLQKLAQAMQDIFSFTLKGMQKKMHLRNAFIQINTEVVSIEETTGQLKTDYNKLDLTGEKSPHWVSLDCKQILQKWNIEWTLENRDEQETAQIHFLLFCPSRNQTIHSVTPIGERKQEIKYPTEWFGEQIYLYSFIQSGNAFTQTKLVLSCRYIQYTPKPQLPKTPKPKIVVHENPIFFLENPNRNRFQKYQKFPEDNLVGVKKNFLYLSNSM